MPQQQEQTTGINQADLGLASSIRRDYSNRRLGNTIATGVDYADLPDIDQFR